MAERYLDLGVVGLADRGPYDAGTVYNRNDLVSYMEQTWTPAHDGVQGIEPVEGEDWYLFAGNGTASVEAAAESARKAEQMANAASTSATEAAASEEKAAQSALEAAGSATTATSAAGAANTYAGEAASSASSALLAQNAAAQSAEQAASSATAAGNSEVAANESAEAAAGSAGAADTSAKEAANSALAASQGAEEAAASAEAAKASETNAESSANTAASHAQAIEENLPQIQAITDNLEAVQNAAENALAAGASADDAAASAEAAAESAKLAQSVTQGQKGYFATPSDLQSAHGTGSAGDWAIVGSTDTIWVWDVEGKAWTNSGQKTDLSQYYTKDEADARNNEVQEALGAEISGKVSKSGDTMTGDLNIDKSLNVKGLSHGEIFAAKSFRGVDGETGFYKITINSTESVMLVFTVRLYSYYEHVDIVFSGYRYKQSNGKMWWGPKATIAATTLIRPIEVQFGRDDSDLLWVSLPCNHFNGIAVYDVLESYQNVITDYTNLFKIEFIKSGLPIAGVVEKTYSLYPPVTMDLLADKQDKLTGTVGQVVGFDADGAEKVVNIVGRNLLQGTSPKWIERDVRDAFNDSLSPVYPGSSANESSRIPLPEGVSAGDTITLFADVIFELNTGNTGQNGLWIQQFDAGGQILKNSVGVLYPVSENTVRNLSLSAVIEENTEKIFAGVTFASGSPRNGHYKFRNARLFKGTVDTGWTPAPEDLQEKLTLPLPMEQGGTGNMTGTASYLTSHALVAGDDLNNIWTPGLYNCEGNATAAQIKNCPVGNNAFTMIVTGANPAGQIVFGAIEPDAIYFRGVRKPGQSQQDSNIWRKVYTDYAKPAPADIGAEPAISVLPIAKGGTGNANGEAARLATTTIQANEDLNNFKTAGVYSCTDRATALTIKNYPPIVNVGGFLLVVHKISGSTVVQILVSGTNVDRGETYIRVIEGSQITDWKKLTSDSDILKTYSATFTASGWSGSNTAGWTQTATATGVTANTELGYPMYRATGTKATDEDLREALTIISYGVCTPQAGSVLIKVWEKPVTTITVYWYGRN